MLIAHLREELDRLAGEGLQRRRRVVQTPCGPEQRLAGQQDELLSFCSNDYMGLAQHPVLIQALAEGAQRWGAGSGASHLVSGHMQVHEDLENAFARWQQAHIPQAQGLLFGSGFMANMALMTALGGGRVTGRTCITRTRTSHTTRKPISESEPSIHCWAACVFFVFMLRPPH